MGAKSCTLGLHEYDPTAGTFYNSLKKQLLSLFFNNKVMFN